MEPGTESRPDVALRAIFEGLAGAGRPVDAWRRFAAQLTLARGDDGQILRQVAEEAAGSIRPGLALGQFLAAAEHLGVFAGRGERIAFSPKAAEEVATALELAGSSLGGNTSPPVWVPVGTIPEILRRKVVVPDLRQTAGVLLDIIDHARHQIWLTAPFIEQTGLEFLTEALLAALVRGVSVCFVTRPGSTDGVVSALINRVKEHDLRGLRVFEVATEASDLGSHAKVCLADDEVCYLGSANLTAYGLGRHLELGARLHGPNVAIIRAALEAIAELGRETYGDHQ